MRKLIFLFLVLSLYGCKPHYDLCSEYREESYEKDDKTHNLEYLKINMLDTTFQLTSSTSWQSYNIEGKLEFIRNNLIVLQERQYTIVDSEAIEDLSKNEIMLVVRVVDPFISDLPKGESYPLEVYLDEELSGFINVGLIVDSLLLRIDQTSSEIIINKGADQFYYDVVLPVNQHRGNRLSVELYTKSEINRDYMIRKIRKNCLVSKNGTRFRCTASLEDEQP